MTRSTAMIELGSSSLSLLSNKKDSQDSHFRWQSILKFIYLISTYSASLFNFDLFSKVCVNVRLIDFIFVESTVGLSYLCMDSFIKQFTRRYDCYRFMSPLLRGISYGRFLQSAYYLLLNVSYVVDCLRFMIGSFREVPPWSMCAPNSSCLSPEDVMYLCNNNKTIKFSKTSAGKYYQEAFSTMDRNALTTRLFMTGVVWMLIFFIASVAEDTIIKTLMSDLTCLFFGLSKAIFHRQFLSSLGTLLLFGCNLFNILLWYLPQTKTARKIIIFKLTFVVRAVSTLITMVFLLISVENHASQAFSIILDISGPSTLMLAARHTCYAYGIGLMGPYDFGLMSPYTMIDTAAVISVAMFTLLAFLRSWIVKTLVLVMTECIILQPQDLKTHILFYAILPFSAEFLHAHKLYVFYLYGNMLMGTLIFVTNLVLLLSKFLSYEFRSVKQIYIVGLLCCLGLALSVPLLIMMSNLSQKKVLTFGIDMMATYLGGLFVAIVMWLYGLGRFATDIQYWLAFRPTRFWTISWALLPVALFAMTIASFVEILTLEDPIAKWTALGWVAFTLLLVGIMNLKVMVGFLMRNNLAGLFKANKHYGPPDSEDRKRRLYYSEFTRQRKCRHNCLVIDDWFDCNHKTITLDNKTTLSSSSSEDGSLLNIYDSKTASRLRSIGALSPAIQIQT